MLYCYLYFGVQRYNFFLNYASKKYNIIIFFVKIFYVGKFLLPLHYDKDYNSRLANGNARYKKTEVRVQYSFGVVTV